MPTDVSKSTTTARKPMHAGTTTRSRRHPDAVAMLREDHKRVLAMFEEYEHARSTDTKRQLVASICEELTLHTTLEEEIFYPAVKEALNDSELVPEARVEHDSVKALIAQVQDQEPGGEEFDAKIKVMGEFVKHHVKEEQNEMFPKAKKSALDLMALAQQMAERKAELQRQMH